MNKNIIKWSELKEAVATYLEREKGEVTEDTLEFMIEDENGHAYTMTDLDGVNGVFVIEVNSPEND